MSTCVTFGDGQQEIIKGVFSFFISSSRTKNCTSLRGMDEGWNAV